MTATPAAETMAWFAALLDRNLAVYRSRRESGRPATTSEIACELMRASRALAVRQQRADADATSCAWLAATAIQRILGAR
jgi:hypothetical protein